MKMKYYISKIVAIVLLFGCFSGFASNSTDWEQEKLDAMNFLKHMEIIPEYEEFNVDMTAKVTRGDLVNTIYNIYGVDDIDTGHVYYYDVPPEHWAYNAVGYLTSLKIIDGAGNKLFEPDEFATVEQAYKMMIKALGYGYMAETLGGFPYGYIKAADRIEISNGLDDSGILTWGNLFLLLNNCVRTEVAEASVFGDDEVIYTTKEGETLLSIYRSIYFVRGDLVSANGIHIGENEKADLDEICVNDVICKAENTAKDLLGQEVDLFYYSDKKSADRTAVWIEPTGRSDVKIILVDHDASFHPDTYSLTYYENNRQRTIDFDRNIHVVYNEALVTDKVSDIFAMDRYTLKLVKNSDGKYYLAMISCYDNYVISNINKAELKIYDMDNPKRTLVLDPLEYKSISMTGTDGVEIGFDDLKEGNVLSVYQSQCGEYMHVVVSAAQINGIIENYMAKDNGAVISVSGMQYYMPTTAKGDPIKLGRSVKLYIDMSGEIAYLQTVDKTYFAAYLIDIAREGAFESETILRYLHQDGMLKTSLCRENVIIDGEKITNYEGVMNMLGRNNTLLPQLALLTLDENKKIIRIDTITPDKDGNQNSLQINEKSVSRMSVHGFLGLKSPVNSQTIFFLAPSNPSSVEDYKVLPYSYAVRDDGTIDADSYRVGDRAGFVNYVVIRTINESMLLSSGRPILVSEVNIVMDDDGDLVEQIVGYQSGNEVTLTMNDELVDSCSSYGITQGALIRTATDLNGLISNVEVIYPLKDPEKYTNTTTDVHAVWRWAIGYAHDVVDSIIQIGYKTGDDFDQAVKTAGIPIMVYDSGNPRNPIYKGTVDDIDTYENTRDECSRILAVTQFSNTLAIVVYK